MIRIGTLDYAPALDHPELLAPEVHAALDTGTVPGARVTAIDPTLADTADFLAAYRTDPADSANCVVVIGKRGGEHRPAACLVPSDSRADVNGIVRTRLDARKASFAPHDWAVEQTGMDHGGITAIGLPADWRLFIDSRVACREWVIIGSGLRGSKLAVPGPEISQLRGAETIDGLGL